MNKLIQLIINQALNNNYFKVINDYRLIFEREINDVIENLTIDYQTDEDICVYEQYQSECIKRHGGYIVRSIEFLSLDDDLNKFKKQLEKFNFIFSC